MSTERKSPNNPKIQEYLGTWGTSIGRVIHEVAIAPHNWH